MITKIKGFELKQSEIVRKLSPNVESALAFGVGSYRLCEIALSLHNPKWDFKFFCFSLFPKETALSS